MLTLEQRPELGERDDALDDELALVELGLGLGVVGREVHVEDHEAHVGGCETV